MLKLRQWAFAIWLYGLIVVVGVLGSPMLLGGPKAATALIRFWARLVLWGLKAIMGVRIEIRGREFAPQGPGLIAGKHQSMLDVLVPFGLVREPCFVLKRELMSLPIFNWYATGMRMIPIDRGAQAAALKKMVRDARERLKDQRQLLIFPEGTRSLPGATPDYKPGVAALYRDLDFPCTLMATNSGMHWPANGLGFRPGTAIYEFLEPIPAGLKRAEFMQELEGRIETATAGLLAERR